MIALVSGEVAVRRADHVVIACGGVGYRLNVSAETLRHVPRVGEKASLTTHLIVRDDALLLYGFATEEERDLFLMLLGVQSVGPKVALAVLSGGSPRELCPFDPPGKLRKARGKIVLSGRFVGELCSAADARALEAIQPRFARFRDSHREYDSRAVAIRKKAGRSFA